jgi:NAD(P)H-hydrate epimerase
MIHGAYPILSCEQAAKFEADFFAGDEAREWVAMQAAGRAVAAGIVKDFEEIGGLPQAPRVLVLAGKGHNGGDALLAAAALREARPEAGIEVVYAGGGAAGLRPLARRALERIEKVATSRTVTELAGRYDVVIDGVFGFNFRAPLETRTAELLTTVNALPGRLRAAVDLPSGLGEAGAFRADFTYATGILKAPLLDLPNAGRIRFLDLGFGEAGSRTAGPQGLGAGVLDGLRGFRAGGSDKRTFGHVLIVAGSRRYPGAAMLATLAALRGGAGLVTAAVPEALVAAFAAQVPEAMWLGLPETPEGGLALEGLGAVRGAFARATAVVLGPGLGRERETLALAAEIAGLSPVPLVIDADALQPEVVSAGGAARVLTPHAGEWARVSAAVPAGAVVVRKGPVTRIETTGMAGAPVYHSFFGGPVLARGGSGDMLAGLTGTLLAQTPGDALGAAVRAVAWHGLAADAWARARGAVAVRGTEWLDYLAPSLRES